MNSGQSQASSAKTIALVVVVAIVTAVAVTLAQHLLMGEANIAVTGGVVGAVTAALAVSTMRKKSG